MTDTELDALWAKMSPPQIDDKTIEELETSASTQERGQQRRICLVAVGRGLTELEKVSTEDPELYGEMCELAEVYLEHAKGLAAMAESAVMRLTLADLRGRG